MIKEEADRIAKDLVTHWQDTTFIVPMEIKHDIISDISAALVDASKVTECAEFEEQLSDHALSIVDKLRGDTPQVIAHTWIKNALVQAYIAGCQKSKALVLPTYEQFSKYWFTDEAVFKANKFNLTKSQMCFEWCLDEIKRINEVTE